MALTPLTWTIAQDLITPHPLGGCRIGATAADGVVAHSGEVFGYRNLFVADGAIVPEGDRPQPVANDRRARRARRGIARGRGPLTQKI